MSLPLPTHRARVRRLTASVLTVLALVGSLLAASNASYAAQPVDEVHYTFTSKTSVAIDWRGDANDVRWGATSAYGNTAQGVAPQWTPWSSAGPFWQLELTGLTAGATYHYSIGGGPDYTFHTPPTGSFRFDAIGDVGDTGTFSHLGDTLSAIAGDDPSFVLMVGDLTYANANGSPIGVVDQHFNDVMSAWSTHAAYIPAWGNHEYDVPGSDDLRNYKGRLLMPNAQTSPGSPDISCCGDDWGWFDAGPVRFIGYPEPWTGAWADWQAKATTLMSQAQSDPSIKYVITYGHRPAYSTGYHPGETQLANILDGFGSTYSKYVLNINGHSHDYERFQPIQGVTHVTVGAPSSVEVPWSSTDPRTAFRAMHLSHLRVELSDTGLRLQSVCDASSFKEDFTCAQGSVIDEYTIGTPPVTPPRTDYYVDKTMSSCNDLGGGTASAPFCTITTGVSRLQPGSTLYVGDGTYPETIKPLVSGTEGSPVTVTGWPGKSPTIGAGVTFGAYLSTKSYVTVSNLTFAGTVSDGIYVTKSDHIVVSGNHVTGAGRPFQSQTAPGISIRATNASTISANTSDHNNGHGIYLTNTSTGNTVADNEASFNAEGWQRNANGINVTSPGNTVLRNVTHDNEDSGINFYTGADNSLAALNVTYNNGDHGIDDLNVTGGRLISNTVFHNCTSGINVEGTSGNYVVENNVSVDNAVYPAYNGISCNRRKGNIGIWDSAPPTTTVDHNLVSLTTSGTMYVFGTAYTSLSAMQAATGQEKDGVQADPQFADTTTGNLQLTEGSPAIDRGDSGVSGSQDRDLLGNPRVRDPNVDNSHASGPRLYDDLGAYEFQPGGAPPASAPTAALTVSPSTGTAPVQVTADASASTDPQGQTLTYAFDFGDGTTTGTQTSPTATHTYTTAGSYTVTVTTTNTSGQSSTASQAVTVEAGAAAPAAALTVSPTSGTAPLQVTADASASTDPQGQTLTYAFDFGDGTTTGTQTSPTATHTYTTAGSYTVTATTTNTSGLTSTATRTVTVSTAAAPTAKLTVSPSSGTAPVQVTADASASTDPQGQTLTYAFDFGDGTTTGTQTSPTATHTYTTAGTYTVTATTTNTSGLTSTATRTVTVSAAPGYVGQVGSATSATATSKTAALAVGQAVPAGDVVVVTAQVAGSVKSVTVTDSAGNKYSPVFNQSDGSGSKLAVLYGALTKPLPAGSTITASFGTTSAYRLVGDELTGVRAVDQKVVKTGKTSTFSSGATKATSAANELVLGVVGLSNGAAPPTWDPGWTPLGDLSTGSSYLDRAYRTPTAKGTFTATGTASGTWTAGVVTFKP